MNKYNVIHSSQTIVSVATKQTIITLPCEKCIYVISGDAESARDLY